MKLKILLLTTIIFVLSLAAVSATDSGDVNATESIANDIPLGDITVEPTVEHDFAPVILTSSETGTFDDLQVEIINSPTGSLLTLSRDYIGFYGSRIHLDKDLIIDGQGHTLDCRDEGGCSAFYSTNGNIVLKNLKIINGHNDYNNNGGAIHIDGSAQYSLENCIFENNWADDYGGAIYNGATNKLNIKNCRFTSNKVDDEDGGVIYSKRLVNIENSIFENNHAFVNGGAIFTESNVHATNCIFQNNKAEGAHVFQCYGGAIHAKGDANIINSTFKDNYAADFGGAIYANKVHINLHQSTNFDINTFFINNKANDDDGGAIYVENSFEAVNTEFSKNSAYNSGGAISAVDGYVDNCLFTFNNADGAKTFRLDSSFGGAIACMNELNITNTIFENNHAGFVGGAVYARTLNINTNQISNESINSFFKKM